MELKLIPFEDMQNYANSSSYSIMCEAQAKLTINEDVLARFDKALITTDDEDFRFVWQRVKGIIEELRRLSQ